MRRLAFEVIIQSNSVELSCWLSLGFDKNSSNFVVPSFKHVHQHISAGVDGGLSGGSSMHRPGSALLLLNTQRTLFIIFD
jgi:hypothetical protein